LQPQASPILGEPGWDRPRHLHAGEPAHRRAQERGPGAMPGQRDSEGGLGFLPAGAQRLRGRWCWRSSPERRTAAGTEAGLLPNPIFMGRLHGPSRLPEGRSSSGARRRPDGNPPTPMYQQRGPLLRI